MPQQKKPTRRYAKDEGLLPERNNNKIFLVIAIIVVVALVAFALSQCSQCSPLQGQTTPEQGAQTQPEETDPDADGPNTGKKDKEEDKDSKSKKGTKTDNSASDSSPSAQKDASEDSTATDGEGEADASVRDDLWSRASYGDSSGAGYGGGSGAYSGPSAGSGSSSDGGSGSSTSTSSNSRLAKYYKKLGKQSDRLTTFVDEVYNSNLYKSLSTHDSDYDKFKELRDDILAVLTNSSGNWICTDIDVDSSEASAKKDLKRASNLLWQRLKIIENAYEAICALPANASKGEIKRASDKACKNSQGTYESFEELMDEIGNEL